MTRYFFTYVWGRPGNPAWPLAFANKSARTTARKLLVDGDLVFTVCTKGEPTLPEERGRVVGLYQVSDLEVNTQDYDMPSLAEHPERDTRAHFPFALHPLHVWEVDDSHNEFARLVGPLTPNHHLQAQSKIVELTSDEAAPLLALSHHEVAPAMPRTELGRAKIAKRKSKLAPKHEGTFTGQFGNHAIWYVYTLVLRDSKQNALAVKVGYANDPEVREDAYNRSLAAEITNLKWRVDVKQPTSSEDAARQIEQSIFAAYKPQRLDSNEEILAGVDPNEVASAIALKLRGGR